MCRDFLCSIKSFASFFFKLCLKNNLYVLLMLSAKLGFLDYFYKRTLSFYSHCATGFPVSFVSQIQSEEVKTFKVVS